MSTIRIRFVTCNGPISWMVRAAEMGFLFSHAEVAMPDGTLLGAHADGGVQARPSGYDVAHAPVEVLVDVPCTQPQIDMAHAYLRAQLGKPYDLGAIAALAGREAWPDEAALLAQVDQPWRDPDRWFCSELVDAALEHAGVLPSLPVTPRRITPRDLYFRLSAVTPIGPPVHALQPHGAAP